MIWVRPDLLSCFGTLAFEDYLSLGERTVKRSPDGRRRTASFGRGGRAYFVKAHLGLGWGEILRSWLEAKPAVVDARTEVRALERCAALAIPTPRLAAWGVRGANPATRRSFVVTEALGPSRRLSEAVASAGRAGVGRARRRALARALGGLVARLHGARMAHRDLNLDHVFELAGPEGPSLALLDLHRALSVALRFERWRAKDLAALHASARALGATRADAAAFLRAYCPAAGAERRALWRRASRRCV
jgi:heptose I phosphotransferase